MRVQRTVIRQHDKFEKAGMHCGAFFKITRREMVARRACFDRYGKRNYGRRQQR